jgi:signal transduction histidine kinase
LENIETVKPKRAMIMFYAIALVLIASAVLILTHLLHAFENDLRTNVEGIQRVFADESVMKSPSDPGIQFGQIEELARKYENHGSFGRITVTKIFGERERVIYPFFAPAIDKIGGKIRDRLWRTRPHPGELLLNDRKLPLQMGSLLLGNLYVRLETGTLNTVRLAIALLSGLLAGALMLFLLQFRRQEIVISKTTVELEQKRRELIRLERLALAGQLSANVFHDLKKPVLNIKNELEELRDSLAKTGEPLDFSQADKRILEQVNLFFSILRESNLERFVRAEDEREFIDLNEILDKSLALVKYERGGVQLIKQYISGLPPLLLPPVRLVQVFSNLILNAYQAMNGSGTLKISTEIGNSEIRIEVADSGPGIPPENLEEIFRPFFTTKAPETGTGLGLYITRDIVTELGGGISVQTNESGTRFIISLPQA